MLLGLYMLGRGGSGSGFERGRPSGVVIRSGWGLIWPLALAPLVGEAVEVREADGLRDERGGAAGAGAGVSVGSGTGTGAGASVKALG
jgi:hypothetical protein